MKERIRIFKIILLLFVLLTDAYTLNGLIITLSPLNDITRNSIILIYSLVTIIVFLMILGFRFDTSRGPGMTKKMFRVTGTFILLYIPKLVFAVFHLIEDIILFMTFLGHGLYTGKFSFDSVTRYTVISKIGLVLAVITFLFILHGMLFGRFRFKLEKTNLTFKNLPKSFDGVRIIQISDLHLGSFYGHEGILEKVVDRINKLKPDLIFFTGDLVNNYSEELNGWEPVLNKLKARLGKYSILGNHDYGDYFEWNSEEEKNNNLQSLKDFHKKIGFILLLNDSKYISINGEQIGIIGVENWGLPPFHQYGDFRKASENLNSLPFKVLLSHDPSHWRAEIAGKEAVSLTLSGHTHAMQFAFRIGKFRWSPSKYIYPEWSGLYQSNGQYLYVNRGLGFIGFPGRIGMRPEIAQLELKREVEPAGAKII